MSLIEQTFPIMEKLILNALQLAEQLHQQLTQETEALKHIQDAELIDTIAANKRQLVAQLEQFSQQLGQVLATEQLPNHQDGVQAYFQRTEAAGLSNVELTGNWAKLMSFCAECRALNEQNGASIELLARHTNRSLHILKGKSQTTMTYGPDGSTRSDNFTRPLISV
jgi:flagellar biosynthesis protein FlgN